MDGTDTSSRQRIIEAAASLLAEGGREAVTIRAVMAAAGLQAPAIYRQFGDMRGLLDAVTSHGFAAYLHGKLTRETAPDPVEDLRRGWDLHIEFGLINPALYVLMYGDPRPQATSPAALEAQVVLHGLVQRVAEAGRLRLGVEQAARLIGATGIGVTLALLGTPPEQRDLQLSPLAREAVLGTVTLGDGSNSSDAGPDAVTSRAVALKAVLPEATQGRGQLTPGEHHLLSEWLDRLSRATAVREL